MVQVDPLVQVDPTLAYAKKHAHRSSCVLNTEQSRGFKCGICLELLSEPVSTPCGHNFCADCLRHAMVCAPRCPLCREQLQGPFRVNHVLGDMMALLQIQSPMKPSPGFMSSRGFGKPWQEKEAPRGNSSPQLPNLSSPRQPLQQLSDQPPPRHAEAQPRAGLALADRKSVV